MNNAVKKIAQRTITALVKDSPGVLNRISGMFRRRGLNIASLAVGHSEKVELSRITFVVEGPGELVSIAAEQLKKLIEVVEVTDITAKDFISRELALIKVTTEPLNRLEVMEICKVFRSSIIDISKSSLTLEVTGDTAKIDSLIKLLREYGSIEVMRTGIVAVLRHDPRPASSNYTENYQSLGITTIGSV